MIDIVDFLSISPYYDAHLVRALQQRRGDVRLLAISPYADWSLYRRFGLSRAGMDLSGLIRSRSNVRRAIALADYAANLIAHRAFARPRVVHVQWLPLAEFTRHSWVEEKWIASLKRRRIPLVITAHNVTPHDSARTSTGARMRMFAQADALICHTAVAREELLRQLPGSFIHVIPHGPLFEDDAAGIRDPDANLVAVIGAIKPYKGIETLLDAWPEVLRRQPNARLVVAGSAHRSYATALRERVGGSVTLDARTLTHEEVVQLHRRAAVVVFPYERITQSGALLTAMAFGNAIVATDLPPFAETLGDAARLVPPRELATAIADLLANAAERHRLGEVARARVPSWDDIAEQTLALYDSLAR